MRKTTPDSPIRLLLTERQAAESLAISPRKLWSLRASGQIGHIQIGRSVRYELADLEHWIAVHKSTSRDKPNINQ
jgi:excisionase family DNA binding protein